MAAAGEGFFDASNDIEDNFSDASDSSFHSLNEDLSKVTIEDSFKVPKKEDSKKNSQCTPSSTVNFSSDTSSADDHKELHQSSTSNLLSEANNSLDDEVNGNDFVEFDICCLESVKAEDIVVEEKLKDRDATSSDEDLQLLTQEAVSEKQAANVLFTNLQFKEAISEYNKALAKCPLSSKEDRAMLFHNRAVSYVRMEEKKLAVHSLDKALEFNPSYLKALVRRGGLHEELGNLDESLQDYTKVLELDPCHKMAKQATIRLPPLIEEKNEKLKAEMMGKLKDLGNMVLRPFGLSTNNFKMQQDPNTGGYNIKFEQNPQN